MVEEALAHYCLSHSINLDLPQGDALEDQLLSVVISKPSSGVRCDADMKYRVELPGAFSNVGGRLQMADEIHTNNIWTWRKSQR